MRKLRAIASTIAIIGAGAMGLTVVSTVVEKAQIEEVLKVAEGQSSSQAINQLQLKDPVRESLKELRAFAGDVERRSGRNYPVSPYSKWCKVRGSDGTNRIRRSRRNKRKHRRS